ncbi:MAG TPA: hypothetical protein PKD67_02995 [Ignavibacteriaceae bacterium]|nr:hypothetical protein [Ignavibacteriaceae bacterium]
MNKLIIFFIILFIFRCTDKNSDSGNAGLEEEIAKAKLTEFKELYFVGMHSGLPSIYRYDAKSGKTKVFWSSVDERVLELLVSEDRQTAYFITKRRQRLKSSKPAIERGELYRIDLNADKVEQITQLEDGIQMIPFWTDNDRFTLVINSIDKTIASYINKNTQVYNKFGKLLSDNNEIFDLIKDGYPVTKLPPLKFTSPNGMFNIIEKDDSIYIKQSNTNNTIKTTIVNKEIKEIGWAENNKQVILLLTNKGEVQSRSKNKITSALVIFDLQKKKIAKTFDAEGYKRFVLIGDFLIFDNGFGRDSFIEVFNLSSLTESRKIKISGGCGLINIPGI